jgi:putative oxidoreductase
MHTLIGQCSLAWRALVLVDLGLLIMRLTLGALLFAHGAQKLFGWFGGPGLAGATGMFGAHLRLRPAAFWAVLGSLTEVGGGLLVALGLGWPIGPVAVVATMLMALTVHWPRFWAQNGGIEYPLVLLLSGVGLGLVGPGGYALDAAIGLQLPAPYSLIVGLIAAVLGVWLALATRAPAPAPAPEVVATAR